MFHNHRHHHYEYLAVDRSAIQSEEVAYSPFHRLVAGANSLKLTLAEGYESKIQYPHRIILRDRQKAVAE